MLSDQSGARPDGREWPRRGYTLDVGDDEYGELIAAGIAAPLAKGRGKRRDGRKARDADDRTDDEKAAAAQVSRDAAAQAHARAAETRKAAADMRDQADELERQADEQEADAADAQDVADDHSRAEDKLMSDDDKALRARSRQASPIFSSDDGLGSAGNPQSKDKNTRDLP
jgi:hypothetical protein